MRSKTDSITILNMRRIKKATIQFISLVPAGANRMPVVYKSDGSFVLEAVSKMDEEGVLLNVVYAPERRDSQGDIASAEVIKEAAYDFMARGAAVDIQHDNKPVEKDRAHVAESFLVTKEDARFHNWKDDDGNDLGNLEGSWATVIKINDPELREKYRNDEWGGVSMGGTAQVEPDLEFFEKALLRKLGHTPEEFEMDEKELAKALAKSQEPVTAALTGLTEAVTKAVADFVKKDDEDGDDVPASKSKKKSNKGDEEAPVFKGDWDDEEAVLKHERAVQLFELRREHDLATSSGISEFRKAQAELKKTWAEEDAEREGDEDGDGDDETTEKSKSKPKEKKVRKGSNAPSADGTDEDEDDDFMISGVSGADAKLLKAGAAMVAKGRKKNKA